MFQGLNGAGKTTIFKLITGEIEPSSGEIIINGQNSESKNSRKSLGYCPQSPSLPEYLTVKETLDLFAKLRGIQEYSILTTNLISLFQLSRFENCLVQKLRYFIFIQ